MPDKPLRRTTWIHQPGQGQILCSCAQAAGGGAGAANELAALLAAMQRLQLDPVACALQPSLQVCACFALQCVQSLSNSSQDKQSMCPSINQLKEDMPPTASSLSMIPDVASLELLATG